MTQRAGIVLLCALLTTPALARGHENDPLHAWFESLASSRGLCCSFADGQTVEDVDWDTLAPGGHYRVLFHDLSVSGIVVNGWIVVPDEAVVDVPNKFGKAVVWPYLMWDGKGSATVAIRCFLPGAGA